MTSRRGGLLLGGAFVTFSIGAALMQSYAVFLVVFLEAFRASRAEPSLAFSVSPLAQLLISAVGWRHAYLAQAALMGVLVWPLAALFRRDEPPSPVAPPGPPSPGASSSDEAAISARPARRDWTLAEAVATPHFWLLFTV